MTVAESTLALAEPRAFGSILSRIRAMVFDAVVVAAGIVAILVVLAVAEEVPGSGRVGVFALFALLLLYEPVTVAWRGGTIGHRRANLRIVDERTGANPSLGRAALRFVLKSTLGLLSFVTIVITRRHQAIHDGLTGTTVQIRDLAVADPAEIRWELDDAEPPGLPSRGRRLVVIAAYVLASMIAMGVGLVPLLSESCLLYDRCTATEELTSTTMGLAWLVASAVCIVAGWRGRLWGARGEPIHSGE